MDKIDQLIKSAADVFHETARLDTVSRRHGRDREAQARRDVDQLMDRILFHYPLTKRASRPDLSDPEFEKLLMSEMAHRTQLMLTVIAGIASDADDGVNPDENTRLTF